MTRTYKHKQISLRLSSIRGKLPAEGEAWLSSLDRGEWSATESILNDVGEERFLKYWEHYKQRCQEVRDF